MSWECLGRVVAEPTMAAVSASVMAGGVQLHLVISFRLVEWPWQEKGGLTVVPQAAQVTAQVGPTALLVGHAMPNSAAHFQPHIHSWKATVDYHLHLTTSALAALEAARNGGPIALDLRLAAHASVPRQEAEFPPFVETLSMVTPYRVDLAREQWLAVLHSVGYGETLVTELRLTSVGPPAEHLKRAVTARNEGRYSDAIAACRIAVEGLDTAPKETSGEIERTTKVGRRRFSDRAHFVVPADYTDGSQLDITIKGVLGRIARDQAGYRSSAR